MCIYIYIYIHTIRVVVQSCSIFLAGSMTFEEGHQFLTKTFTVPQKLTRQTIDSFHSTHSFRGYFLLPHSTECSNTWAMPLEFSGGVRNTTLKVLFSSAGCTMDNNSAPVAVHDREGLGLNGWTYVKRQSFTNSPHKSQIPPHPRFPFMISSLLACLVMLKDIAAATEFLHVLSTDTGPPMHLLTNLIGLCGCFSHGGGLHCHTLRLSICM